MDGIGFLRGVLGSKTTGNSRAFEKKDVPSLAKYIKSDSCQKICFMLGAGVSTSAGIPDFRSPETGLYANLARLKLPYPEAVFDIGFFRRNPHPFYTLAKELYPGKYRPTLTHSFIKILSDKGLLGLCFTQNIDTLERRAGIPAGKIIEAHGSFATQRCIECRRSYSDSEMKEAIEKERIPMCHTCKGLVKPDIVFFGESLPSSFFGSIGELYDADLLIVIGTSLTVHPFASLVNKAKSQCPRVLINLDKVGDIGSWKNDLVFLGKCDEIVRDLARELGWEDELDKEWAGTSGSLDIDETTLRTTTGEKDRRDGSDLDLEIEKITKKVEGALSISERDNPRIEADIRSSGETSEVRGDEEQTITQSETPQKDVENGKRSSGKEAKGIPVSFKHDGDITLPLRMHDSRSYEHQPTSLMEQYLRCKMICTVGKLKRRCRPHLYGTSLFCRRSMMDR
ncbi:class I sirtuins SIR2 family protein [Russula earlei]|uniref:Class I sirtuins SIR2 family protein n=1 Tax=Russula earlei TaxID=71964 RepID=A0ACC0UB62_9AGAM|nr:class I sirtuins SIR2 family protein [Russula earlei]